MPKLTWTAIGERFYETGLDRGVLYVDGVGVSWPGLISVSENPTGGEARPYYQDGIKYLNLASDEEFEATINAYFSPVEFDVCDGIGAIDNGLFSTQQPRKPFGLSYRTRIGNDLDGPLHGYKLHIVYDALASPSVRNRNTTNAVVEATSLSWNITTRAPSLLGRKGTAHFVLDSRQVPAELLAELEELLYGSDAIAAQLPTAEELISMFVDFVPEPSVVHPVMARPLLNGDYPLYRTAPGLYTPTYGGTSRTFEWVGTEPYLLTDDDATSYGAMHQVSGGSGFGISAWMEPWTVPDGKIVTDIQVTLTYKMSVVTGTPEPLRFMCYNQHDQNAEVGPWWSQSAGLYHEPVYDEWTTVTFGGGLNGTADSIWWTDADPGDDGSLQDFVDALAGDSAGNGMQFGAVGGATNPGAFDLAVSYVRVDITLADA